MKLSKSKKANINYLAKIVEISQFRKHSDPKVEKLKCCTIDGFNIITSVDAKSGLYVYFPGGCCLNPDFLKYSNLYRKGELNDNPKETGMFDENGRVKTIKLRGELSEGFIMPIIQLQNYIVSVTNKELDNCKVGIEFDIVEHEGKEFWINKKYIPKNTRRQVETSKISKTTKKVKKGFDKIITSQFRFHYDTYILKKNPQLIQPDDYIHISEKIHGTSHISAYVLCNRPAKWYEKCFELLTRREIDYTRYDYIYASRSVIKNQYYNKEVSSGYYKCDVWAEANKIIRPYLIKGMTVYAEIVGFLPNGGYIQKGYDYGCIPPKEGETYTHEIHFKVRVYRVTLTNVDGIVHEFSPREVALWCESVGLTPVTTYYYGLAKNLYSDLPIDSNWCEHFLERLSNDKNFYMELNSPSCNNKVPHEGIVIKKDNLSPNAVKVKCFKFINGEETALDKGEINIEDEA